MTSDEVRKALGEPSPGESVRDTATGESKEQWIYGAGDNALFLTMVNGKLASWEEKRATMKDAAAKVREGMTEQEVVAILGPPDSGGGNHAEYLGKVAAIDSLVIDYQNGKVTKVQVVPNAALNNQGSRSN
jgi:hypothetical protein